MSKTVIDLGVEANDLNVIYNAGISMFIYILGGVLTVILISYITSYITSKFSFNIRSQMFRKVTSLSLYDFNVFDSASLMTRATTNISTLQRFVLNLLRSCLLVPVIVIAVVIQTLRIDVHLAAILIVFFIFTLTFMITQSSKTISLVNKLQDSVDRLNLLLREKIFGVRSIRALGKESFENEKFNKASERSHELNMDVALKSYYVAPISMLIMNVAIVVIYIAGGVKLDSNMIHVTDLILFFQYVTYFTSSLSLIPFLINIAPRVTIAARRIEEVLYYEPTLINNPKYENLSKEDAFGGVEFKNIIFGYNGAKAVLSDINFKAKKGTVTAIIGSTGSGKTTLMELLDRLYDPTFGEILIDGVNIKDMDLKDLHKRISFASQESMVFNDSVYENIKMANENITKDDAMKVCEETLFTDAFRTLPDGIDSVMSEGGTNVSGGQRQRLSLARTIAQDADIYIFDDAFSALDIKTENIVKDNIKKLLTGKTIFIVAQKISTVLGADNIIVLDGGRIVGQGTHEELLETCNTYQEIYATQSYIREWKYGWKEIIQRIT